jgi:hypothetical protein
MVGFMSRFATGKLSAAAIPEGIRLKIIPSSQFSTANINILLFVGTGVEGVVVNTIA